MTTFRDDFRFDSFFFFKDQLENQLGISLSEDSSNSSSSKENFDSINKELEPYKSRITINSWEAASLIVNNHPDADWSNTIVQSFKNSILNAVKNGVLISTDRNYDINDELCYAEVYTNDVGLWAKKHNYNWPLPLDENKEANNQNNNELEQRIKQLEEELNKQRIINSNLEAIKSNEQVSVNNNQDLTEEIKQLKLDNQKLTEQLNKAQIKIEELKEQIPILLGEYRADDPLLLAIQIRNKEWSKYNERDRRTRPTQDAICEALKANYNVQTDQLAKAIELVSCPINRSK